MPVSLIIFFALILVFAASDIWLLVARGYAATMSANLYAFGRRYPIIPFLIGIAIGHAAWPNESACVQLRDAGELPAAEAKP